METKPLIFVLSLPQRRALEAAADGKFWPVGPGGHAMATRLIDNNLLRHSGRGGGGGYSLTEVGRLVLTVKPRKCVWWYDTRPETAHDVRHLAACSVCGLMGLRMPTFGAVRGHGACLVRRFGWRTLVQIDDVNFGRFTMEDYKFLGVQTFDAVLDARKNMPEERVA